MNTKNIVAYGRFLKKRMNRKSKKIFKNKN